VTAIAARAHYDASAADKRPHRLRTASISILFAGCWPTHGFEIEPNEIRGSVSAKERTVLNGALVVTAGKSMTKSAHCAGSHSLMAVHS